MNIKRIFLRKELSCGINEIFIPEINVSTYIFNILRANEDEKFELFTPSNKSYFCKVFNSKKKELIIEKIEKGKEKDGKEIILFLPLMKGKKIKESVKKLVEVGVDKIIPVEFERSIKKFHNKLEEKILIWAGEAAAQSHGFIPEIGETIYGIDSIIEKETSDLKLIFDFEKSIKINSLIGKKFKTCSIITGPEGGFSNFEREKLRDKGFISVKFNTNILRCETAPIAAVLIVKHVLDF